MTAGSRPFLVAVATWLVAVASVACADGLTGSNGSGGLTGPAEAAGSAEQSSTGGPGGVTVPDEISGLDSDEVERRLGRLLDDREAGDGDALAAQEIEPTPPPDEPTLQEILDLLNNGTAVAVPGKIVISVSAETLSGLAHPVLTIKTPPEHGTAIVISPNQIIYMPGDQSVGGDSFEYELFDGSVSVVALVVEVRR